jgi:hypothetical protein
VELAIVLTVLLVLVFGMIDVGLMLSDSLALSNLAKDAARSKALGTSDATIVTRIRGQAGALGIDPDPSKLTFSFTNPDTEHVAVTLNYPHTTIAGNLVGLPSIVGLSGTGIHRKE